MATAHTITKRRCLPAVLAREGVRGHPSAPPSIATSASQRCASGFALHGSCVNGLAGGGEKFAHAPARLGGMTVAGELNEPASNDDAVGMLRHARRLLRCRHAEPDVDRSFGGGAHPIGEL